MHSPSHCLREQRTRAAISKLFDDRHGVLVKVGLNECPLEIAELQHGILEGVRHRSRGSIAYSLQGAQEALGERHEHSSIKTSLFEESEEVPVTADVDNEIDVLEIQSLSSRWRRKGEQRSDKPSRELPHTASG